MNYNQYIVCYHKLMAYSIDFRKKVLDYCERTHNIAKATDLFNISRNTIYQWLKLQQKTGKLEHQAKGIQPKKVDRKKLIAYLEDYPDAYLSEIATVFDCHPTTIHYALKSIGYIRKTY